MSTKKMSTASRIVEKFSFDEHSHNLSQRNSTSIFFMHFNPVKGFLMLTVILTALLGNALVIISVLRMKHLRKVKTNYFIISMAVADLLMACLVMPFNASQAVTGGHWYWGSVMCDIFNSNDILFSTASITHLCCISMDRYIAVLHPLKYQRVMTKRRVATMLTISWLTSCLISYIPVHTGIYSTQEFLEQMGKEPDKCPFNANPIYALSSSTISFWIPCIVMTIVYLRIFKEAGAQEKRMIKQQIVTGSSHRLTDDNINDNTSKKPNGIRIKRENKAAKTLGIIMGCFILCWLPFFLWYGITTVCSENCPYPNYLGELLFWIGYANSSLNPVIYGAFNREFRHAFISFLCCRKHQYRHDSLILVSRRT